VLVLYLGMNPEAENRAQAPSGIWNRRRINETCEVYFGSYAVMPVTRMNDKVILASARLSSLGFYWCCFLPAEKSVRCGGSGSGGWKLPHRRYARTGPGPPRSLPPRSRSYTVLGLDMRPSQLLSLVRSDSRAVIGGPVARWPGGIRTHGCFHAWNFTFRGGEGGGERRRRGRKVRCLERGTWW
jgi:hypothetical protein